jgi:hypothetical protein
MIEDEVRALFTSIADGAPTPSRVDTGLAYRRGRARLRWWRAGVAGAPVLAAAAVAGVVLAAGAVPFRSGPGPAVVWTVAPLQFDPLAPYVSFGWLPAGDALQYGGSARTLGYQVAGPSAAKAPWLLQAYPNGRCRLSGPARTLRCTLGKISNVTLNLGGRAAAVHGRPAFWARTSKARTGEDYLVWQYARGGWSLLSWSDQESRGSAWQPQAVRIANRARFGAHAAPPLAFATRLTGVPASWQVSSVVYHPHGAMLLASRYAVTASPAALDPYGEYRPGLPVIGTQLVSTHGSCSAPLGGHRARKVIGGYQVLVRDRSGAQPLQWLCARHADGLWVEIAVYGKHPVLGVTDLFAHHLRLLGPDPAHWARNPIG